MSTESAALYAASASSACAAGVAAASAAKRAKTEKVIIENCILLWSELIEIDRTSYVVNGGVRYAEKRLDALFGSADKRRESSDRLWTVYIHV